MISLEIVETSQGDPMIIVPIALGSLQDDLPRSV